MTGDRTVLTPSQVGGYLKNLMDRDRLLSSLLVRGELSNYKMYPSGHHYFTLKDSEGALRCVMFRGDAQSLRFRPENGMQVVAAGRITVFPRDGQYQMYCVRLTPDGAGDLAMAFEQLKERLLREGLFDQEHKRPIPKFPKVIALVTSPAGGGGPGYAPNPGYPLAYGPGEGTAGPCPGRGRGRGDRRRHPVGQLEAGGGPDYHGPRRRLYGGLVGLQ